MSDDGARFSRQRRLPEVGERGQALLGAARARVTATPAGDVAREYLVRAGFGAVLVEAAAPAPPFPHSQAYRFDAPRQFGAGASYALGEVRRVLGLDGA
ncbi:MAG TPA: hypothetical protein VF989_07500 [Polyangiaceae bacterium]|jgi:hypothetical protein